MSLNEYNFNYMFDKLPTILQTKNNELYYRALADIFANVENEIEKLELIHLIDSAFGSELDDIGSRILVFREGLNDEQYKRRIRLELYTIDFVPLMDNFIDLIQNVLLFTPTITEGWKDGRNAELDVVLRIPPGETEAIFTDLDRVYSAGVKLNITTFQQAYAIYKDVAQYDETGVDVDNYPSDNDTLVDIPE